MRAQTVSLPLLLQALRDLPPQANTWQWQTASMANRQALDERAKRWLGTLVAATQGQWFVNGAEPMNPPFTATFVETASELQVRARVWADRVVWAESNGTVWVAPLRAEDAERLAALK